MSGTPEAETVDLAVSTVGLPAELTDVACKLAYFVSPHVTAVSRDSADVLRVRLSDGEAADAVAKDVRTLLDRLAIGFRPLRLRRLFGPAREADVVSRGAADLTAQIEARGWARRHDAGLWAFGPELLQLMEAIDGLIQETAEGVYAAPAHRFPALIATETLRRAGYVSSFPQNLGFVSHLPQRLPALISFQEANAAARKIVFPPGSEPGAPQECLPPAVCYHRWRDLSDRTLGEGTVITARGNCFRYEARHNMQTLVRLWSFQMREIIYMGDAAFVRGMADKGPGVLQSLLKDLEIAGWCETATDPFFVNVFGPMRYAQVAAELKFELRLPLGNGESLAAASLNLHQDHFGKAFAIRLPAGAPAVSGCTAFGVERLALGFLAQHGFDRERWPLAVSSRIKNHVAA